MNKLHRSPQKSIAGVCTGIAETFGIDPIWIKLAFVISIFFGGTGILLYLILWIILPVQTYPDKLPYKRLYRSLDDKLVAGVCSGLAKYLDWDVSLIRLIFIILILSMGSGFLYYLILWIIVPQEPV